MDINEVSNSIGYCGLVYKVCHLADKCDGCKPDKIVVEGIYLRLGVINIIVV